MFRSLSVVGISEKTSFAYGRLCPKSEANCIDRLAQMDLHVPTQSASLCASYDMRAYSPTDVSPRVVV